MEGDGDVEMRFRSGWGQRGWGSYFKQRGTAPLLNNPIRRLEISRAGDAAERGDVVSGEEEGVGELVGVEEEG